MATTEPFAQLETIAGEVLYSIPPEEHGFCDLEDDLRWYASGKHIAVIDDERLWTRGSRLTWLLRIAAGLSHPDPPPKVVLDRPVPVRETVRVTAAPASVPGKVYEPVGDVEVLSR